MCLKQCFKSIKIFLITNINGQAVPQTGCVREYGLVGWHAAANQEIPRGLEICTRRYYLGHRHEYSSLLNGHFDKIYLTALAMGEPTALAKRRAFLSR